jgi:pyruvate/2-oxoglutarate dehydrogenase complex dihydrolipoamide acyltransferase (E2) component
LEREGGRRRSKSVKKQSHDFKVVPLPDVRHAISDMLHEGKKKHMIHGLFEVDVTVPRQTIRDHREKTGEKLSFTAFLITCLAQAVDEDRIMHAYRKGKNKLVLFDEVDVNTQIEREVEGRKWVMPYIIRGANMKSFYEIHQEIRNAQAKEVQEDREFKQFQWYLLLPGFVRRLFWRVFKRSPHMIKNIAGTVGMTAIGMFGKGGGWGIPITTQTLEVTAGGIEQKPGVVDGRMEMREVLSITLSFDHDIIDGAPAARFTSRLQELIEGGFGLQT